MEDGRNRYGVPLVMRREGRRGDRARNGIGAKMRSKGNKQRRWNGPRRAVLGVGVVVVGAVLWGEAGNGVCLGEENPLDNVHTPAPPPPPNHTEATMQSIGVAANPAALSSSRRG